MLFRGQGAQRQGVVPGGLDPLAELYQKGELRKLVAEAQAGTKTA